MDDQLLSFYWPGYLAGVNDAAVLIDTAVSHGIYCVPSQGIENDQLVRVAKKYLDEHPKDLHLTARILVLLALREAFFFTLNQDLFVEKYYSNSFNYEGRISIPGLPPQGQAFFDSLD